MQTKQMLITPIAPTGQVAPAPILVRKGILKQIWEMVWDITRNLFALYGLLSLVWWLLL